MCLPVLAAGAAATTATGTAMTALSVASMALSAMSAVQQSKTTKAIAESNAKTAEIRAQEAERLGEQRAIEVQRKGAALKSSQQVAMAAKGLDLGYGTAADLQDQTDFFTQSDVATTRTNTRKDAYGYRAQGANYQAQANAENPTMAGATSLLAGANQVASRWYKY